jgi:hypothetical protein
MMKSSNISKVFITVGAVCAILILISVGFFLKRLVDRSDHLKSEVVQFKQLTESLVRSSNKWATKGDLGRYMRFVLTTAEFDILRNDMRELGASVMSVGRTVGSLGRKISGFEKSDKKGPLNDSTEIIKCEDGRIVDTYGYTRAPQIKELTDISDAPLARAQFNAARGKPWNYEVYKRDYHLSTVIGKKDDGQLVLYHSMKYMVPGKSNKKYPIELKTSEYLQAPESDKMFWWNPRLDFGAFAGGGVYGSHIFSFGVEFGFSFSSYGATKVDSLWRFFRISAGYDAHNSAGHFSLSPIAFNFGRPLPLLTNLWAIPYFSSNTSGTLSVGLGIGLQL